MYYSNNMYYLKVRRNIYLSNKVLWSPNNKFYVYLDYVQDSNCYRYPPVLIVMIVLSQVGTTITFLEMMYRSSCRQINTVTIIDIIVYYNYQ